MKRTRKSADTRPQPGDAWSGQEITVGTSVAPHTVKPRIVGPAVSRAKFLLGICQHTDCNKIAGHTGEHS